MNLMTPKPSTKATTGDEDKPPFFLPNRAAYRRVAKGVKTRQRKATKWAYRMESNDRPDVAALFTNLAEGASRDLTALQEARS